MSLLLTAAGGVSACDLPVDAEEARRLGERVSRNETGGDPAKLLWWNEGESFASVGLGHFIWYPEGVEEPFRESFPALLLFLAENDVALPSWLGGDPPPRCPWPDRDSFLAERHGNRALELERLLNETVDLQVAFMLARLAGSRARIREAVPASERDLIEARFCALAATPAGRYALLDYVNFKGEGVDPAERYADHGWGLLQVLEGMSGDSPAHRDFADAAAGVLERRVRNAPPARGEGRWLPGWLKRVDSYRES
jgi:hypothetical protein